VKLVGGGEQKIDVGHESAHSSQQKREKGCIHACLQGRWIGVRARQAATPGRTRWRRRRRRRRRMVGLHVETITLSYR